VQSIIDDAAVRQSIINTPPLTPLLSSVSSLLSAHSTLRSAFSKLHRKKQGDAVTWHELAPDELIDEQDIKEKNKARVEKKKEKAKVYRQQAKEKRRRVQNDEEIDENTHPNIPALILPIIVSISSPSYPYAKRARFI
jgi:hypothetical protein